jgi:hypothetical protein
MDLMGFAILERIATVAAAALIGYWGYRIYLAEKSVGLVFLGLSALILIGALATGAGYVRNLGTGMQMASTPVAEPVAIPERPLASPVPVVAGVPDEATEDPAESPFLDRVATVVPVVETAVSARPTEPAGPAEESMVDIETAETEDPALPLATGEELGGRIVSVKSDTISLEWSSDSD